MARHLKACAFHLLNVREKTGREILLGLEPEPFCFLETTDEAVRFFDGALREACDGNAEREIVRRHIGVCFDTCHAAVQFELPKEALQRMLAGGIASPRSA